MKGGVSLIWSALILIRPAHQHVRNPLDFYRNRDSLSISTSWCRYDDDGIESQPRGCRWTSVIVIVVCIPLVLRPRRRRLSGQLPDPEPASAPPPDQTSRRCAHHSHHFHHGRNDSGCNLSLEFYDPPECTPEPAGRIFINLASRAC